MFVASVVASAFFMENLDQTIVVTAIPEIARSLGEPPLQLRLVITSYLLSLAVFMPISGWIADRFGARTVFCAALGIFTVGSALSGLSDSLAVMIPMRILQGFGGALMTPIGRLIILRTFPRDRLVTAMMYMSIPAMIGPTLGPIIGGFLATYVSWAWRRCSSRSRPWRGRSGRRARRRSCSSPPSSCWRSMCGTPTGSRTRRST
jgi:MFS family permease